MDKNGRRNRFRKGRSIADRYGHKKAVDIQEIRREEKTSCQGGSARYKKTRNYRKSSSLSDKGTKDTISSTP